jgi:ribonuclease D
MQDASERPGFDQRMDRQEINSLPVWSYPGRIVLVRTPAELAAVLPELGGEKILGFDTETKPNFQKGENNPPALLQLAGETAVWIFQLVPLGLPEELSAILADPGIIKTGVAVDFDLHELQRLGCFQPEGFAELATVAKESGIKNHGLRGLAAVMLGYRISKGAQRSNWGAEALSERQLRYAATDAWAGREIYLRFEEMGVICPELHLRG